MKALTLRSPWAWCVCYLGKPVENRGWAPSRTELAPGDWFAIHASKLSPLREIQTAFYWMLDKELVRVDQIPTMDELRRQSSSVVAVAAYAGAKTKCESAWFAGRFGWTWSELLVLPTPVPCRGFQKLWTVPADVEAQVLGQIDQAHSGSALPKLARVSAILSATHARLWSLLHLRNVPLQSCHSLWWTEQSGIAVVSFARWPRPRSPAW